MYTLVVLNTDEALQSLTFRQVRATIWRYRQLAGLLSMGPPRMTFWSVRCDAHCFARVTRRMQDAPPVRVSLHCCRLTPAWRICKFPTMFPTRNPAGVSQMCVSCLCR